MEAYTPVPWDFREMIDKAKEEGKNSNVHYFCQEENICTATGAVVRIVDEYAEGEFLELTSGEKVRLDKIITLYGKPGPAYEEYDAYSNACLDCMGGYDPD